MKHRNAERPVAIRRLFIRKGNEHGICVAVQLPIPPYLPIRKGDGPCDPGLSTQQNTFLRKEHDDANTYTGNQCKGLSDREDDA